MDPRNNPAGKQQLLDPDISSNLKIDNLKNYRIWQIPPLPSPETAMRSLLFFRPLLLGLFALLVGCGGAGDMANSPPGVDGFSRPATTASGLPLGLVAPTPLGLAISTAPTVDRATLMAWAEANYVDYFRGTPTDGTYGPYDYRYYPATGNYIGLDVDKVYVLGPITDNELMFVGTLASFACQIYPNCIPGGTSVPSTSPWETSGNVHNLLKTWLAEKSIGTTGSGGMYMAREDGTLYYDIDGRLRGLISQAPDPCVVEVTPEGHISYNGITYKYEPNSGATNTTGATTARLYGWSTETQTATHFFVEIDKTRGFLRSMTENTPAYPKAAMLQEVCDWGKLGISSRFPLLGTFFNTSGRFAGTVKSIIPDNTSKPLPTAVRLGASCQIVINNAGQATVNVGGLELPVFSTYDTSGEPGTFKTMLSANPFLQPEITYALQFSISPSFDGTFIVHFPTVRYWDLGDYPSFSASYGVACVTSRVS